MTKLPPLEYRDDDGIQTPVDVLVPGFIEVDAAVHGGEPVLVGTRWPASSAEWMGELLDKPEKLAYLKLTREDVIALINFNGGRKWQGARSRRKRWRTVIHDYFRQVWERTMCKNEYEPGDETQ